MVKKKTDETKGTSRPKPGDPDFESDPATKYEDFSGVTWIPNDSADWPDVRTDEEGNSIYSGGSRSPYMPPKAGGENVQFVKPDDKDAIRAALEQIKREAADHDHDDDEGKRTS